MLRVVIDTSTLVSFILTAGDITSQIIAGWRRDEFTLLTTPQTRTELRRVLEKPRILKRTGRPLNQLADEIDQFSLHLAGSLNLSGACRDPKDDMFLACAVEGEAHYLVGSDRDLLDLRRYKETCILNPGEFLIVLQFACLTSEEIRERYSRNALEATQRTLCLDVETMAKLADAMMNI